MPDQSELSLTKLEGLIRNVPDFPKPGILFKDITPLLRDPAGLSMATELMAQPFIGKRIDLVAGAESRGFIFATAIASKLSAGFVPIRKPGKLPAAVKREEYELEYGTDSLEIHTDAIKEGDHVLMVDDLLATGGTMDASCRLIESLGGKVVGIALLIELVALKGRDVLADYPIFSLLSYDD